ncbi:Dehydrogenase/reductase SDR family member 4 [Trichoplax sp. H2]|uniref:Dehydrogenase/reductase SDR family member 4 n=1 Tax=Trichoplax adhaerens TaxID=10228 RepID=B3S7M7_TRIAD|nr:hypothetical protein TRIADDRAFT_60225 [Trichoplax adhaerens]EDV21225.1 hypothetical protein TRIADDRAFT_60225 [Trichoplax adhaerens]RDD47653.1 Dehydrogenase/reductase SDR family member 4 [Trichoplax sp. H2]|eukprot:XP_002116192.1 hypothetical protein TRIADDRAFT_60225 [Trichoplax adhaerens]
MALRKRFENKVVVITGSTEGIGFATAQRIAAEGGSVSVSSRHQEKVDKAIQLLRDQGYTNTLGRVCDVSKEDDIKDLIQATVDKFGAIDVLVCNAAVAFGGPVIKTSSSVWDKTFSVNLKSAFTLTKEVLPYLKQRDGSNIVLISSILGHSPMPVTGVYSVSKTAMFGLMLALTKELGRYKIRVNAIAPGVIATKMSLGLRQGSNEDWVMRETPLRRYGQPEEIASAVAYVSSDEAAYVNGSTIVVGGGLGSRL